MCEQNDILRYHPERIFPKKACNIKEYSLMCGGKNFGCPVINNSENLGRIGFFKLYQLL